MFKRKKNVLLIITIIEVVAVLLICVIFLVPKLMPDKKDSVSSSSVASVSSLTITVRTLEEVVNISDTVILGTVIKADFDSIGVLYTMNVIKVYKGRNYTSLGYAYVTGKQSLSIGQKYLFVGITGVEKYHYIQPYNNAPWVFSVSDDGNLTNVSNGDIRTISDIGTATVSKVQEFCNII